MRNEEDMKGIRSLRRELSYDIYDTVKVYESVRNERIEETKDKGLAPHNLEHAEKLLSPKHCRGECISLATDGGSHRDRYDDELPYRAFDDQSR